MGTTTKGVQPPEEHMTCVKMKVYKAPQFLLCVFTHVCVCQAGTRVTHKTRNTTTKERGGSNRGPSMLFCDKLNRTIALHEVEALT